MGLVVANRDISRAWKATDRPSVETWRQGLDHCMALERTVYVARGCPNKFYKIWSGCATYRDIQLAPCPPRWWSEEVTHGDPFNAVLVGGGRRGGRHTRSKDTN